MTLAAESTINGVNLGFTYGLIPNNAQTWDYNRMFGCNCDEGWQGYDCSLRSCLNGDDPNSTGQLDEIQSLSCINPSNVAGTLILTFRGASTEPISSTATAEEVKTVLELLPTITSVSVEVTGIGTANSICTPTGDNEMYVSFLTEHGDLPLLEVTKQDIQAFLIAEVTKGNKENIECSGRGKCDTTTGSCFCFSGYGSSDGQGNKENIECSGRG